MPRTRPGAAIPNAFRARGLTLIELLAALAIFALLSAIAYSGLDSVLRARTRVSDEASKWQTLAYAFVNVRQSLRAAVDRPVRDSGGAAAPAFVGTAATRQEDEPRFAFTRMGYPDQPGALADVQRVGYRLKAGRVEQLLWPAPDAAPTSVPYAFALIDGAAGLAVRYRASDGAWHPAWPAPQSEDSMPAAVELAVELSSGERIVRQFALR